MKNILNKLFNYQSLEKEEAREILTNLASGAYNPSQMAAFMTVFMMRNITVDELSGFRDAMLELCVKVPAEGYNAIDLCGTGGDGKDTFNISTLASFVVAGAGYHVAKHGNYGVSSVCGSSNVLEYLGCKFSNDVGRIMKSFDQSKIAFLHAPMFHPAMKNVAPIRKELGVKTFFNMLGPMVNPAAPANQMVGVFNLELARLYGYLYQNTDKKFLIVHSLDGYDEISLTGDFKYISDAGEAIGAPSLLGLSYLEAIDLAGGTDIKSSAKLFKEILYSKGTSSQNSVVIANAGMAISTISGLSFEAGVEKARTSLISGKAKDVFNKFLEINN
ncbi:MAG: anthranilate phosphoribosyltransferase [Flammeovirgaceae bacterium]|nr:anthranilate phosphoribosyltransferase [Flammeovirgaceae bacterium]|tara:strand:- start:1734 stop:2726 length:993 start_codon:yes stop_codon:yes gene_type:complete